MSTDFLYKKWLGASIGLLAFVFTFCSFAYAYVLSKARIEPSCGRVYFLVSQEANVEVGAHFAQWEGGAGYLFSYKEEDYVAMSVYFEETDGATVQAALLADGKETELLALGGDRLCFKSCTQKKRANAYLGALRAFYGCLQVFGQGIALLEQSTQEKTKTYYLPLERQFSYLGKEYEQSYPDFSKVCKDGALALRELSSQTLYVKDLRYLLCELSEKYVTLTSAFSL